MCGIVGYIGRRNASEVIIKGLQRLEYRGYDSAGMAVVGNGLELLKTAGKVAGLSERNARQVLAGTAGIGHTRWATHGEPNDVNAHPHKGSHGQFAIVHNGIIENYNVLKQDMEKKGHVFKGETDTEVLAHLIEEIHDPGGFEFTHAVKQALTQVKGTYGIAIVHKDHPDHIIAARKGSPLLIGIGEGEYFVASDASPVIEYTQKVIYLEDEEVAVVSRDGYHVSTLKDLEQSKEVYELAMNLEQIAKGGYPHFMLKEISYIHAEGYPAAEMKHGPIALIDEYMPVVVIAATNHTNEKLISNVEEIKARKGRVIAISTNNQSGVSRLAEFNITVPEIHDCFSPLIAVIPLQLLSYYIAVNRNCDVDQPRNLAKSVTVE